MHSISRTLGISALVALGGACVLEEADHAPDRGSDQSSGDRAEDSRPGHIDARPNEAVEAQGEAGLDVFAGVQRAGCNDLSAHYEVTARNEDGEPVDQVECAWTFDDGETSSRCTGTHVFAEPGIHGGTVRVTDPASSTTVTVDAAKGDILAPLESSITVTAPHCGLHFDYSVHVGGGTGHPLVVTQVRRDGTVVSVDRFRRQGTFQLEAPGTYLVKAFIEDETAVWICEDQPEQTVTLVECDD